jgi:hypothetical protein
MITKKGCLFPGSLFNLSSAESLQPPEGHYCIYVLGAFERNKPGQKNYPFSTFPSGCIPLSLPPQICIRRFFRQLADVHWVNRIN